MAFFMIEKPLKGLRACMNCSLLKTFDEFLKEGCDNCEKYVRFKNNHDRVKMCSSKHFEGLIGLPNKNLVWTTRMRKVDNICFGAYAIYVFGHIPIQLVEEILRNPE